MFQTILYPPVPRDTSRAAGSLYGKGNVYLRLGDALDELLFELIPSEMQLRSSENRTPEANVQCALLNIFQFAEELTNQQIVEALRNRVDLKYALHLPLNYPSFDPNALCEFRRQLFADAAYQEIFQTLLDRTAEFGLFKTIQGQPVSARQVLVAVCTVTRFEEVVEGMHQALEALAVTNPEWLRQVTLPYWYDRYNRRTPTSILHNFDKKWKAKVLEIGSDIQYLLGEIDNAQQRSLASLPAVKCLRQIWEEQFILTDDTVVWRNTYCSNCNIPIQ